MKLSTITVAITALALGGALLYPGVALAYRGDPNIKGPNYTEERHTAMEQAFASNDYSAWKALMGNRGRVTQVITEDTFAQFAKAHELAEDGHPEEAAAIRQELGLDMHTGTGGMRNR